MGSEIEVKSWRGKNCSGRDEKRYRGREFGFDVTFHDMVIYIILLREEEKIYS
jgi:hypothetical protein